MIKNGKMKNTLREIILEVFISIEPKDITELLQNIAEESQECAEKRLRIAFRLIIYNVKHPVLTLLGFKLLENSYLEFCEHQVVKDILTRDFDNNQDINYCDSLKLIQWILKRKSESNKELSIMAIKQHIKDFVQETKPMDMTDLIHTIDLMMEQPLIIPDATVLQNLCEDIVGKLATIPMPRESANIALIRPDIKKLCDFFKFLAQCRPQSYEQAAGGCLKKLYRLITNSDKDAIPSPLASTALNIIVDDAMIPKAVIFILSQHDNASKDSIKVGFHRLVTWLRTFNEVPSLNLWINQIILTLRKQERFDILEELALENIDPLFLTLIIPTFQGQVYPVVQVILQTVAVNSPEVFNKIVPRIPKVLQQIIDVQDGDLCQTLMQTVAELIHLFPDYTDYTEITEFLALHYRSSSMSYLQLPPTHFEKNTRIGLQNLGNTCYMNSVFQALFFTKQFTRCILLAAQANSELLTKMQHLIGMLLFSERPDITPKFILSVVRPPDFLQGYQQDSSEFLGHLLDKLHEQEKKIIIDSDLVVVNKEVAPQMIDNDVLEKVEEYGNLLTMKKFTTQTQEDLSSSNNSVNEDLSVISKNGDTKEHETATALVYGGDPAGQNYNFTKPNHKIIDNTSTLNQSTLIQKIFGGKISTTYKCNNCRSKSVNIDSFRDLQLSFPEISTEPNELIEKAAKNYSVQGLLDFYCSSENLDGDNQYFCSDQCKLLCDGSRVVDIVQPPKNLILTLKHFRYDSRYHTRAKLLHNVYHDEIITLKIRSNANDNSFYTVKYLIYGAVVHSGMSMDSGHYVTYASDINGFWFKLNDNYVTKSSLKELHSLSAPHTPYILFYHMIESNSNSMASSTITSSSQMTSPSKILMEDRDDEGAAMKKQCLSDNQCSDAFPEFDELPTVLREWIREDNSSYKRHLRLQQQKQTRNEIFRVQGLKKHNRQSGDSDNDDNDDPPNGGTCGDNQINYCNKFIF